MRLKTYVKKKYLKQGPEEFREDPKWLVRLTSILLMFCILGSWQIHYGYFTCMIIVILFSLFFAWNYLTGFDFKVHKFKSMAAFKIHFLFLSLLFLVYVWILVILFLSEDGQAAKEDYILAVTKNLVEYPFQKQFYIIANLGKPLGYTASHYNFDIPNYSLTEAENDVVRNWFAYMRDNAHLVVPDMVEDMKKLSYYFDVGPNVNNQIDMACLFSEDSSTLLLARLLDLLIYKYFNIPASWLIK